MARVPVLASIVIALVCVLMGPDLVRAQHSSPEPPVLPEATAPLGLATVSLPEDFAGIAQLFEQFPAELADQPRVVMSNEQDDGVIAAYGEIDPGFGPPLRLGAMNFSTGDFFPTDFSVADFVASAADPAFDYDAVAFGQDGTLAWVQAETMVGVEVNPQGTPASSRTIYTLAWGEAESSWLFTAAAFSSEGLDTLVSAFVATARNQPGTPAVKASPVALGQREHPYLVAHRPC